MYFYHQTESSWTLLFGIRTILPGKIKFVIVTVVWIQQSSDQDFYPARKPVVQNEIVLRALVFLEKCSQRYPVPAFF